MEAGAANDEAAASTGEAAPKKARAFRHFTARELYRVFAQMSFVHESNSKNMRTLEKLLVGEQQRSLEQARHKETSA